MTRVVVIGGWAPSLIKFRGPLLAAMVARGHEVVAIAPAEHSEQLGGSPAVPHGGVAEKLAAMGVAFEAIELERTGLDPVADARAIRGLVRRLRELGPELVLGYTIKPVIYGSVAARLAGVPRRAAMITGMGSALTSERTVKQRLVAATARTLYRVGLAQCQTVIFQNTDDRDELRRLGVLPPDARVAIVRGSGVDLAYYAPRPLPDGPPVFIFVGRLLRDKGIAEYVAAARKVRARYPAARFQIVGWLDPNPESLTQRDLDALVANGVIEYLGAPDDVRPALGAAHVLVLPSYREGTPRSVLEAMSMARAVITTTAPGCRDTVIDGDSGLLVPVRDPDSLAAAMIRLLESPPLLARLAAAGHARAVALYDARLVASSVLAALEL
ncbi:MAG TPA: glycosyltransferase family 4 protein [Kofleriaceae bacterium]|nr:glycosyltransferase family 4 protein [Kofleriaceae bacterium]